MTANEHYLYIQAAQLEFDQLCKQIVHDGRDSGLVAYAMTDRLNRHIRELRALWDARPMKGERNGNQDRRHH